LNKENTMKNVIKVVIVVVVAFVVLIAANVVYYKTGLFAETRTVNTCTDFFKDKAHNPDAVEVVNYTIRPHLESEKYDRGNLVVLTLRGENAFGALRTSSFFCFTMTPDVMDVVTTLQAN